MRLAIVSPLCGGDEPVGERVSAVGSLLIVTGPPGAGKSTVARILVEEAEPSVLVEGDAFFAFLARGAIEPWRPESNTQNTVVTRAAAAAAGHFARGAFTTVYDGVVGPWFLPTFADAAGLDRFDYVILLPPVEECVRRVRTRSDHGFSDEAATRQMHANFANASIDERYVLRDPSDAAVVARRMVTARDHGDLTYLARRVRNS